MPVCLLLCDAGSEPDGRPPRQREAGPTASGRSAAAGRLPGQEPKLLPSTAFEGRAELERRGQPLAADDLKKLDALKAGDRANILALL